MKNSYKNELFDSLVEVVENDAMIEVDTQTLRMIARAMSQVAMDMGIKNNQNLTDLYKNVVNDLEVSRFKTIEMIQYMEKAATRLIDIYQKDGMVKMEYDSMKKRNVIVARTSVLKETIVFLNKLNELVAEFYEDVYKIDLEINKEKIQGKLF